ncbi:MAG: PIN domain-containing protein [Casimicrobiaceae bacterium]|nr:PIN domain-containing protein [Casimicrobiaceae bacterium]
MNCSIGSSGNWWAPEAAVPSAEHGTRAIDEVDSRQVARIAQARRVQRRAQSYGDKGVTIRIGLDTCVLAAALRSCRGASFALLEQVPSQRFELAVTVPQYFEWEAVLIRPEHVPQGLSAQDLQKFLAYLVAQAHNQEAYFLFRPQLRDPRDELVLECALAARGQSIVTHNVRDFAAAARWKISVVTPREFLALIARGGAPGSGGRPMSARSTGSKMTTR